MTCSTQLRTNGWLRLDHFLGLSGSGLIVYGALPASLSALGVVNGVSIQEYQVDLGMLEFGHKLEAKATLAMWRVRTTNAPIVAEFGYQLKFDSLESVRRKQRELSEFFYTEVQSRASDWLQRGTTKTALIYGFGNTNPKHQE